MAEAGVEVKEPLRDNQAELHFLDILDALGGGR